MITKEIASGEVTSRRAKRVLYPVVLIFTLTFVLSAVRWQITGYAGFSSGSPDGAGYTVVEHGHTIHLTAAQYWLGRMQILILVVGVAVWFIARAYFFRTGDLKRENKVA